MFYNRIPRLLVIFSSIVVAMLLVTAVAAFSSDNPTMLSTQEEPVSWQPAADLGPVLELQPDPVELSGHAKSMSTVLAANTDPALISISKQVDAADTTRFDFHGDLGDFSLLAGESVTFTVDAGDYRVYEAPLAGWELANATCDSINTYTFLNELWISVQSGETVSCTFSNENRPLAKNIQFVGQLGGQTDAVAVQGNYAYLGEGSKLTVLDIRDPSNPILVGQSEILPGLVNDVVAAENSVYLAVGGSGLYILDVSDPSHPAVMGSLKTPGYAFGVALSGSHAVIGDGEGGLRVIDVSDPTAPELLGWDANEDWAVLEVVAQGDMVYAVGQSHGATGLAIYDISNPANPGWAGGAIISADSVWDLSVAGNFVYAATDQGLTIFDATDPAQLVVYGPHGIAVYGVAVVDDLAYVTSEEHELLILDVSDPGDRDELGQYEMDGFPKGVAILGDYAFVTDWEGGLHILDVTDSGEPFETSFYDVPFESVEQIAAMSESTILAYATGSDTLQGADLADPTSPFPGGLAVVERHVADLVAAGEHAYVADGDLRIFSLANPAGPVEEGSVVTPGAAQDVAVQGGFAYVADGSEGLRVIDVSTASAPSEAGHMEGSFVGVAVAGTYAFTVGDDGLTVIDISDPESPGMIPEFQVERASFDLPGQAQDIEVSEGYAYVLSYQSSLHNVLYVIAINNPEAPEIVATHELPGWMAYDLIVDGATVYVASGQDGLRVIDAADPAAPVEAGYYNTQGEARDVTLVGEYVAVSDYTGGVLILRYVAEAEQNGITIAKETEPVGTKGSFAFTGDLGSFSLSGGQQKIFSDLAPGEYTISEAALTGWELEGIVCDSVHVTTDEHGLTLELGEGDHITCTFHNNRLAVTADAGGPYTGNEGTHITLDARGTTNKDMVITYEWDCHNDGFFEKSSSKPVDKSCKYADNGVYTVKLRTIDIFGQTSEDTAEVTVSNVPPQVAVGPDQQATIGQVLSFSGSFTDPGTADTFTVEWDFGDGSKETGTLTPEHAYRALGQYTVMLSVTDDDGDTGSATLMVDVVNSPPTLNNVKVIPAAINEGESFYLSGALADPEGDSVLTLLVDWGDSKTLTQEFAAGIKSFSISHSCADDPPGVAAGETYTIRLKLSDEAGAYSEATLEVEVDNVAPEIDAGPDQDNVVGEMAVFNASLSDPGMMDTLTVSWDFGDGSPTAEGVMVSHVFQSPGTFTVTATVEDDDGGVGVDMLTVAAREVFIFYMPVFAK